MPMPIVFARAGRMRAELIVPLILVFGLAGCATLERGTKDQVFVVTDPPGAVATISNSIATCVTPCRFDVDRTDVFTISVTKPSYDAQQIEVKTQSVGPKSATSEELTPDYLGRMVDYRDGANLIHMPNPVSFKLLKSDGSPPDKPSP